MLEKADLSEVWSQGTSFRKMFKRLLGLREFMRVVEDFYNMICKWYVPTKHAGMLPPKAEEMLN